MNSEFLNRLAAAQTDDERSWLVTEMRLAGLAEDLRSIVWAAAIVHRFDAEILAVLRPEWGDRIGILYEEVSQLSFVEALEDQQHKLHDLTRRLMLEHLWAENREEFQLLSLRAAQYFSTKSEKPRDQIEATYHWMDGREEEGISRFSRLIENWRSNFQDSALQSLFQVLDELIHSKRASAAIVGNVASAKEAMQPTSKGFPAEMVRKSGVPFPRLHLPENFVKRPKEFAEVKARLLAHDDRALVISAIAGLGGLGKSILAIMTVLDAEIQEWFEDGILWTTLGQQPDLLSCLGGWIRELDKSRDAFSANTLESASQYLESLLVERRMLLVIDDVWDEAHAKWFCVGGLACRVLVTTRQVRLAGATYLNLDVMSPEQSIELVRRKMGRAWKPEDESDIREFAKELGYLPLGLDLAANHLRDGFSWRDLKSEFNTGRRMLMLENFGSAEALLNLNENEKRQYSLKACFELSLRLMKPSQVEQFAWLGVLPEDINLTPEIGMVLWDLPLVRAKKVLIDFQSRSLLMDGVRTEDDERTYQIHDLMHDMARDLIKQGVLNVGSLEEAHQQFLERYLERSDGSRWDQLPQDGYIHKHLTWHLEQAGWIEQIHQLLEASDELGRNAWFEACEQIGEPAVFVKSVGDAWRLTEEMYDRDRGRAIVLQCRYALMMGSLNSLLENLPASVMAGLVKDGLWSLERAWAYVEQMQNEEKIAEAIQALADILTKPLFEIAVKKTRSLQEQSRALAYMGLTKIDSAYFTEAVEAVRSIQASYKQASVLSDLAKMDFADFSQLLEVSRSIQDKFWCEYALGNLAEMDSADFSQLLEAARSHQDTSNIASVLCSLAQRDLSYLDEALATTRSIQDMSDRAWRLIYLAKIDSAYLSEALEAVRSIQDVSDRAERLIDLAKIDSVYFSEALEAVRSIQDVSDRAERLIDLAKIDSVYFSEALEAARSIQDTFSRALALSELSEMDSADFSQLLEAARSIQDASSRAGRLIDLTKNDSSYFSEALEVVRSIQDASDRAKRLIDLTKIDSAYLSESLEAVRSIQGEFDRAKRLIDLAEIDSTYFPEALEAIRSIKYASSRAWGLIDLAKIDSAYLSESLEAVRSIQDTSDRAERLIDLAKIDSAYFPEALEATRSIKDESSRARILIDLAKIDSAYFPEALEAARSIKDTSSRAGILSNLAESAPQDFLPTLYSLITEITHKLSQSQALSNYISRVPLDRLPYTDWTTYLHLLAHRTRADLMGDLATLYPAILHLGGEDAGRGMVGEMGRVCRQWK